MTTSRETVAVSKDGAARSRDASAPSVEILATSGHESVAPGEVAMTSRDVVASPPSLPQCPETLQQRNNLPGSYDQVGIVCDNLTASQRPHGAARYAAARSGLSQAV